MSIIDGFLNKITMYRLVLYYLIVLLAAGFIFAIFGLLPFDPFELVISTLVILIACWFTNLAFAAAFETPANVESVYITALILALIISPIKLSPFDMNGLWFLIWASVLAMASKYIFAINRKHIFNPAAIAVAITALALGQYASWWVGGNLPLMSFVIIGGLLVVRKIQRFDLVLSFIAAALASIILSNFSFDPITTVEKALMHTSLFFFAFIMLSEPLSTPPTRALRIAYGALVGALFSPAITLPAAIPLIGGISSTPELALVIGNLFSFIVSPKGKYLLKLREKKFVGTDTYDFVFTPAQPIQFKPGQYMEWTLAHADADARGNRRYFTIASSPTEPTLRLGVKFYPTASTFKKKLLAMQPGERIMGGSLAGDFTLPRDPAQKLVFIAGGIGITPFRSMIKYLSDTARYDPSATRDIVLLYSNRAPDEIAYADIFAAAQQTIGLRTIFAITDEAYRGINLNDDKNYAIPSESLYLGRIDVDLIRREIPDYRERIYYISGPRTMIIAFKKTLADLGIPRTHIKSDFFPGFA